MVAGAPFPGVPPPEKKRTISTEKLQDYTITRLHAIPS
jgi:hypothetical protein